LCQSQFWFYYIKWTWRGTLINMRLPILFLKRHWGIIFLYIYSGCFKPELRKNPQEQFSY
jgi:hypothetical protein